MTKHIDRALEFLLAQAGYRGIEVESGPVGLVIYGPTQTSVAQVAAQLAGYAKLFDDGATAEPVCVDASERDGARFVTTVRVNWGVDPFTVAQLAGECAS